MDDKGTNYPADRMVHPSVYDTKDFHDSLMMQEKLSSRAKHPKPGEAQVRQFYEYLVPRVSAYARLAYIRMYKQS